MEWYDRTGNEYWNKTDVVTISSILCLYFVSILFRKLKYIVGEMVETERDYVKALDYIIQVIIICDKQFSLLESSLLDKQISLTAIAQLLGIRGIYDLNVLVREDAKLLSFTDVKAALAPQLF